MKSRRLESLIGIVLQIQVFWVVTHQLVNSYQRSEGIMILQNIGNYLPADVLQPRRLESSATLLQEPQISQVSCL
jgi:hypothetical protein